MYHSILFHYTKTIARMTINSYNTMQVITMKKLIIAILSLTILCFGIYVQDYYKAIDIDLETSNQISIQQVDNYTYFSTPQATTGIIFYPGGKVETMAYVPLFMELAKQNILCILVDMPFHLAVLDMNAANGIQEQFPNINSWYISGHSLGGSIASSYIEKHATDYEGLILLASYSTSDLSKTNLKVISIYGSNDEVLNIDNYIKNYENLPTNTIEHIIQGGNHAQFGNYGTQKGDGIATITTEEQQLQAVNHILDFIINNP